MYLMFEALGKVADRELMLVNLDLLDFRDEAAFPGQKLNFVLFNPTDRPRTAELSIPSAADRSVRWTGDAKSAGPSMEIAAKSVVRLQAEF